MSLITRSQKSKACGLRGSRYGYNSDHCCSRNFVYDTLPSSRGEGASGTRCSHWKESFACTWRPAGVAIRNRIYDGKVLRDCSSSVLLSYDSGGDAVFSCCTIRWVTGNWKVIDDSTANRDSVGVPHLLNEADDYQGYVLPKGSLVVPNAWYASSITTLYSVSSHVLSGQCSGTREFTWTRIVSTQTASWPLKAVSRRWIPAMLVYLDLGGGRSTHEVGRKWS